MSDIQTPNGLEPNETLVGATDEIEVYQPASAGVRRNKRAFLDTLKTFFITISGAVSGHIVTVTGAGLPQDSGVDVADIATNAGDILTNTGDITLNTTHRGSDGKDHSDVVANTAAVALNTTHRSSDGTDHTFIDQDIKVAAGPTFNGGVQTDGTKIRTKIVNIGDWNMDTTVLVNVAHGLTFSKIRGLTVVIRNDSDTTILSIEGTGSGGAGQGNISSDSTNIILSRVTGGAFDGPSYDSTSFNRGWITITYEA